MSLMRIAFCALSAAFFLASVPAFSTPARETIENRTPTQLKALQQRLIDANCYSGTVDGVPSEALRAAVNACPDQRPKLRIEPGMHTSAIRRIDVDGRCTLAATASEDKTVRLWSLPEGRESKVLRWPVGTGNLGKAYATAVSSNGQFIAAGGFDAQFEVTGHHAVTVFDGATGAIVARVGGFKRGISNLTFSKDGRWLAASSAAPVGVRMIDTSTWREVAADDSYGADSYSAVFDSDGNLFTTALDNKIRKYGPGPGFQKDRQVSTRSGRRPFAVAVNPDGKQLAVGMDLSTEVDFYDTRTLAYRGQSNIRNTTAVGLTAVASRSDGEAWLAGGRYEKDKVVQGVLLNRDGHRVGPLLPLAHDTVADIKPCASGFALASLDPAFGLVDANGKRLLWLADVNVDMREKLGNAFLISPDARKVRFGMARGAEASATFDLDSATLVDSPSATHGLIAARVDELSVSDWRNTEKPKFAGKQIVLPPFETSRSLAVRPQRDGFVLGTDRSLFTFDAHGKSRWAEPIPNPGFAVGVNLSADGRIIVVAYGDGTIRWRRWSDGEELLALFVNKRTRAWVAWTPTGYYAASPGAEDMIGWHVNRGWDQAADFFPASKFHDQFARPDIVEKILDTLDEDEAVRQADAARGGKKPVAAPVIEQLPPVISILSPAEGSSVGDDVRLDYLVRSPSGLPVDAVQALVNGNPISSGRGLGRVDEAGDLKQCLTQTHGQGRNDGGLQGCRGALTVSLPAGANEIGLFARAGGKTSEIVRVKLVRASAPRDAELLKPKLYALVVGISAYANPDYALAYPSKDAHDFAAALKNQNGGLYREVEIKLLTDREATAAGIREGLDWLTKQVTSRDVGVVYLAGHGVLDERERFYFLAADSDGSRLRSTAVPREDISDALDALPGKALLFLDACHSGAIAGTSARRSVVDVNTVVNDLLRSERGVVVFAASTGRQVSQENTAWNNGAFTKAVVEGLGLPGTKGKADLVGTGSITTSELDAYVVNRVKDLTEGRQSPVMIRPPTVPDFPVAMSR